MGIFSDFGLAFRLRILIRAFFAPWTLKNPSFIIYHLLGGLAFFPLGRFFTDFGIEHRF